MKKLLITGISGGQGRLVSRRVAGRWRITGVDRMPWEGAPEDVSVHVVDLRKRRFDNVFRVEKPDAVVHLAFVRHFRADPEAALQLLGVGEAPRDESLDATEHAAWTHLATMILNLDEAVSRS